MTEEIDDATRLEIASVKARVHKEDLRVSLPIRPPQHNQDLDRESQTIKIRKVKHSVDKESEPQTQQQSDTRAAKDATPRDGFHPEREVKNKMPSEDAIDWPKDDGKYQPHGNKNNGGAIPKIQGHPGQSMIK